MPLPVCAQAARLRIARITAVPTAIFFIDAPNVTEMDESK